MAELQTTDYEQIQENEIEVLQSIFMEDFVKEEGKAGAWNKKADREFRLKLRSSLEDGEGLTTTLSVSFPATYPKTLPRCQVQFDDHLSPKARKAIGKVLREKAKEMLGSEMIHELALAIQDILADAVMSAAHTEGLPALDEERAKQESEAREKQEIDRLLQEKERQHADDEDQRLLSEMVKTERERLARLQTRTRARSSHTSEAPTFVGDGSDGALSFDQEVKIKAKGGTTVVAFRSIVNKTKYRDGPVTSVYTAVPGLVKGSSDDLPPSLALKCCTLKAEKRSVQGLEARLETLWQMPSHQSVLQPLAFKIEKSSDGGSDWHVHILTAFAQGRSVRDILETVAKLDVGTVRSWTIQLLEGLDFLHRHHIVHARVRPENVLLDRTEAGNTVVKLADGGFQHDLHQLKKDYSDKFSSAASAYWMAPESASSTQAKPAPPRDIWDLGVVLLQMLFGLDIQRQHNSPNSLVESLSLSQSFEDLLARIFKDDPKKRPSAFELLPSEFLRDNAAAIDDSSSELMSKIPSLSSYTPSKALRVRHDSNHGTPSTSRYANDFVEAGRLGKGGFGEVVRARNKVDGSTYAIKKIVQSSTAALSGVLSEVMLLSRLNNPFIVRYYAAWIEEEGLPPAAHSETSSDEDFTASSFSQLPASKSQGLDFISSGGNYPKIEFGYGSDEDADSEAMEDDDDDDDEETEDERLRIQPMPMSQRRRSSTATTSKVTLYIQMEYCERQTLRDLMKDLHTNTPECWRLFRQILEGLAHVHGNGVIHRDLKPENIFITLDESNTVRIGDFGLARPGEASGRTAPRGFSDPRLTASIGTSMYVAPEVRSSGGGRYNEKADMYSLGIILFEMSYPLKTGMERAQILESLRQPKFELPPAFKEQEKSLQGEIIQALVKHKPSERPSSHELLKSGKVPSQIEDETIRNALASLSDKSSPFYSKLMSGLFSSQTSEEPSAKDYTYDFDVGLLSIDSNEHVLQMMIKDTLAAVFRRHGAVEAQRQLFIPSSRYYESAVKLLDASGTVVNLPYDLTLPFARTLAKQSDVSGKYYSFGTVYREAPPGLHPRPHGEVDFDIVTGDSLDLALREAEVIKVIDEIIDMVPSLSTAPVVYHVTHSKLLGAILLFCGIANDGAVKQIISRLNIGQWTWAKIRNELRAPGIGVASTSLDDLVKFNFREPYEMAIPKLRSLLQNTEELESTFRHLEAVVTYLGRFQVRHKVFISPLSSVNEKFYHGNILFQCISDSKRKRVLCAGGRYDRLIQEHRTGSKGDRHAVGFNLAWENLLSSMASFQKSPGKAYLKKSEEDPSTSAWRTRRCDVLIDSIDPSILRSSGIRIVQQLWAEGISAELVIDSNVREAGSYQQPNRDDSSAHDWIVLIKADETLKVRSVVRKEDTEIRSSELVGWLRSEIRERDRGDGRASTVSRQTHHSAEGPGGERDAVDVAVLVAQNKSKKTNRRAIVEDAHSRTAELASSFLSAPIVALEMKDDLFDQMRDTRLSDPDSWRRFVQNAPLAERQYVGNVHDLMLEKAQDGKGGRNAFVYNFRTRACFYYDLGLGKAT